MSRLAIEGGPAIRRKLLPYGRQCVSRADESAVLRVLRSDWLTTGPDVELFEKRFSAAVHAPYAVSLSSGTAALHAAIHALGIGPGDEVVVPAMTFAASANCVVYQGATPVFADVDARTLLLDPADAAKRITSRTKAIVGVDYAGQPCDYNSLRLLGRGKKVALVADACHSLGATAGGRPTGSLADITAFSFHPVKHITTAEGGMLTTANAHLARLARSFRNHGIETDFRQRERSGSWFYEMTELGFNYRLSDIHAALGTSQLKSLPRWVARRRSLADYYREQLAALPGVVPLRVRPQVDHSYHLFVVRLDLSRLRVGRREVFQALRAEGIGVNVHYIPVHLHPYYRRRFRTRPGLCPVAERAYEEILSLPMHAGMTLRDVDDVVAALRKVLGHYER